MIIMYGILGPFNRSQQIQLITICFIRSFTHAMYHTNICMIGLCFLAMMMMIKMRINHLLSPFAMKSEIMFSY